MEKCFIIIDFGKILGVKNCQGKGGRTEERLVWYLVRYYTVRGHWQDRVSMYDTVYCVYYTLYF